MHAVLDAHGLEYDLEWALSGPPFLSPRGGLVDVVSEAVRAITGVTPELSTSGGTSDGRFLAAVSREVVEFGPVSASIHGIDEHVALADIAPLSQIYEHALAALARADVRGRGFSPAVLDFCCKGPASSAGSRALEEHGRDAMQFPAVIPVALAAALCCRLRRRSSRRTGLP